MVVFAPGETSLHVDSSERVVVANPSFVTGGVEQKPSGGQRLVGTDHVFAWVSPIHRRIVRDDALPAERLPRDGSRPGTVRECSEVSPLVEGLSAEAAAIGDVASYPAVAALVASAAFLVVELEIRNCGSHHRQGVALLLRNFSFERWNAIVSLLQAFCQLEPCCRHLLTVHHHRSYFGRDAGLHLQREPCLPEYPMDDDFEPAHFVQPGKKFVTMYPEHPEYPDCLAKTASVRR
ncbi:hypothetical protein [Alicyclobacillus mengziensis]|uniref:Uncharacterized protein n=1 Tax=Alicyclobacillus mengziensis TaxID=2931921 RepID=A0A9X7Z7T4_9BACL|nr:hypothetical protein [Alicyclobacillus mengziensis]QSO49429.1 hypothetical protein JZ786_11255 [Alicyclobacillus mengziensis]